MHALEPVEDVMIESKYDGSYDSRKAELEDTEGALE